MRFLKPSWVSHDGKPIFSIDIHPDGSRFATGGQGDNAGRIVVWNMAPVREEKDETNKKVPKMLCQMDNHLACVNCVRWSNNGKYLASGSDDKLVMVWQTSRYSGASSVFGSDEKKVNLEQWRCVNTLRGHSGDVLDVAWSPQDIWLATCSIDNTIVVWNANKLPEQVAVLKGHTGLVKGVTWDPVGKYLASQSDDKSLRVWKTLDWQQESCVTEPFQECGGTTHVLRLGWSPDGHYLVSAHAMNNSGPTAQIIERNGWKVAMDFVGHRKAVTVVRFNPNILSKKIKKNSDKPQQYSCCAIGSRDRSLSVWLTALKRPLVVTHDLFSNSILDISWSQSGIELLCCSWDGTVAFLDFSTDEIGTPLTTVEKNALHQRIYGKSLALSNAVSAASQIIETTAMLKLQQEKEAAITAPRLTNGSTAINGVPDPNSNMSGRANLNNSDSSEHVLSASLNKQIETKTQDGRRRITPIFLAPQPALGEVPLPFSVSGQEPHNTSGSANMDVLFTTTREQSTIVIERKDVTTSPGQAKPPVSTTTGGSAEKKAKEKPTFYDTAPIQPITMSTPKSTPKSTPAPKTTKSSTLKPAETTNTSVVVEKPIEVEKPRASVKRPLEPDLVTTPAQPPMKKKDGRGRPRKYPLPETAKTPLPPPKTQVVDQVVTQTVANKSSELALPVPTIDSIISIQISGSIGSDSALVVEVENAVTPALHMLRCMQGGKMVWDSVLSSKVNAIAGNSHVVCAACADHTLVLLSATSGRRLIPLLVLDSTISTLRCSGNYVMAVTSKGAVYVWNIPLLQAVIKNESLLPIIPNSTVKLVSSLLTEQGLPIMTMSTGKSYTFKGDLGTWIVLSSKKDKLQACSDHQRCLPSFTEAHVGPLASLQAHSQRPGSQAMSMFQSNPSLQQPATLSHLENQVACSLALKSSSEYHFWLLTYIRYLVMQGQELKLREVCDELLGPTYRSRSEPKWAPTVLGHTKRKLLGEILPVIGSNLSLQRLFTEYQEQLDTVKT